MRWTRSLKYSCLNAMVPVAAFGLRALGATMRKRVSGRDRVDVFLQEGRVAFFGTIAELDASPDQFIQDFMRLDEVSFLENG